MQEVENSDPTTFNCEIGETITVMFRPQPGNSVGRIIYCLKQVCSKNDQIAVIGNEFTFHIKKNLTPLQIWFFFIPGEPLGQCDVKLVSSTGEEYVDPTPAFETSTGEPSVKIYLFEVD